VVRGPIEGQREQQRQASRYSPSGRCARTSRRTPGRSAVPDTTPAFSLRTGEPLRAPALTSIPCFDVEQADGIVRVRARRAPAPRRSLPARSDLPNTIVIVGGAASGQAAAETLRREGYAAQRGVLGQRKRFDCVPLFWTEQYEFSLAHIGHAERWDNAKIDGRVVANDCTVTYRRGESFGVCCRPSRSTKVFARSSLSSRRCSKVG
jgi:hypothetical protein